MNRLRNFWALVWRLVDSDSVRHYVWIYYLPLLAFGVYATFWLPENMVQPVMGHAAANIWQWIQIPATLAALGGLVLRRGDTDVSDMSRIMLRRDWFGLCMQAGGHACMCNVLISAEIVMWKFFDTPVWIWVAFGAFAIISYVIGTALLTVQCFRKVHKGLQLQRTVPV